MKSWQNFKVFSVSLAVIIIALPTAVAQTINISSASQLKSALDSATGGETLRLAPGNYGKFDFHDYAFNRYVTITSASAANPASFENIDVSNASYLRFEALNVSVSAREGVGIFNASHHIEVVNLDISGSAKFNRAAPVYTQVSTLYGINTNGGVRNLRIENNRVTDIKSAGYLFSGISHSLIKGNDCDWTAADCYKLAGVDNILFENNIGARNIYGAPTAHIDFVQGQGSVSDSVFRGNVALSNSPNASFQGLFFDDATYTNLTFENNIIATTSIRGISVSSPTRGIASSGIIARNNTIIRVAGTQKATLILLPKGSTNEFNFVANNVTKNAQRFVGNNIIGQWDDADDIAHYDLYYVNASKGFGLTIDDLRPVSDSITESSVGAYQRIFELLESDNSASPAMVMPAIMLLIDQDS